MPRRHRLWTLGRPPRPTSSPASPLAPPASRPDSRSVHYYRSMIILSNCVAIATARVLYNSTMVLVFMSNCSPNISTSEQGQTSYSAYFGAASQSIITPATAHRPVAAAPDFSVLPRSGFSLSCRWRRSASQLLSFHARIPNPTIPQVSHILYQIRYSPFAPLPNNLGRHYNQGEPTDHSCFIPYNILCPRKRFWVLRPPWLLRIPPTHSMSTSWPTSSAWSKWIKPTTLLPNPSSIKTPSIKSNKSMPPPLLGLSRMSPSLQIMRLSSSSPADGIVVVWSD